MTIDLDTVLATLCKDREDFLRRFNAADPEEQDQLNASESQRQHYARKRAAYRAFGELNGWTQATRYFGPDAIGRKRGTAPAIYEDGGGASWFHDGRKNVAIIEEPYGTLDQKRIKLEQYGLRWHVPPMPFASIRDPGVALFIVITSPDVQEVKWFPEQVRATEFKTRTAARQRRADEELAQLDQLRRFVVGVE
jgi:hypothetical protein